MAKKKGNREEVVILVSESGFTYATKKSRVNTKDKLLLKKYDPQVRKHVEFKEKK
jgi:large subunit ribosomal protein L33